MIARFVIALFAGSVVFAGCGQSSDVVPQLGMVEDGSVVGEALGSDLSESAAEPLPDTDPTSDSQATAPICERAPSVQGNAFADEVSPEKLMAFAEEIKATVGVAFTGVAWQSSSTIEVYATAEQPPVTLEELEQQYGFEIVYKQVPSTNDDLDATIGWIGQYARGEALDIRLAYTDASCGAVVLIVGDDATQAEIEHLAAEAGRLSQLAIFVDPFYIATLRESAKP